MDGCLARGDLRSQVTPSWMSYAGRRTVIHRLLARLDGPRDRSLIPLIVASSGRSGTTATMQLLSTSLSIVFDRVQYFESAYLSYFIHWSRVVDQGKKREGAWRRASLDHEDYVSRHGLVGALPWVDRPAISHREDEDPFRVRILQDVWSRFSEYAIANHRRLLGDSGSDPIYYAETAPIWVVDAVRCLGQTKAVYLIRDPRDQYMSIMSFIRQKGRRSFGYQEKDTPETFATAFAQRQRTAFRKVLGVEESGESTILRYESLVSQPQEETQRLGNWLGVSLDWKKGLEVATEDHITSKTPSRSVGRWHDEMPSEIKLIFDETMSDELMALGYDA